MSASITTVTDDIGAITGPLRDGGSTDDTQLDVSVDIIDTVAQAGDVLRLYNGDEATSPLSDPYTLTSDDVANGFVTVLTATLTDGTTYQVTAVLSDSSDSTISTSAPFALTVDTAAPSAPSIALSPASDSGTAGDGRTNDATPTLTGTAEAGSTVEVFDGATSLGTAEADSAAQPDGTAAWTFTPTTALLDGLYSITATATDAAGNVSDASTALALAVDTTSPAAPLITSQGELTNSPAQTVVGTAEPGSTVEVFDGVTSLGTAVADSNGDWTAGVTLTGDGPYSLTATATDAADNTGAASAAVVYTLDTTAPALTVALSNDTGASATDGTTNDPALSGTAEANATVSVSVDGGAAATVTADGQGGWTYTPTGLADGSHTVAVGQTDRAGNTGMATAAFTLDTAAPALAINNLGGPTNDATKTIQGTAEPGSTVVLTGGAQPSGPVPIDTDGVWSLGATLTGDGPHSLTATATDAAGNTRTATVGYTLDTLAPAAPAITGQGGLTNSAAQTVAGTAEPGSTVTLYDGETPLGTAVADDAGDWSRSVTLTARDGDHELTATARDPAGNTGAPSAPVAYVLDTTQPTLTDATITATSGAGELRAGQGVTLLLTASEAVEVNTDGGTPTLELNSGGTAAYTSTGQSDRTLSFTYTVQPGDNAATLAVSALALNGATVQDAAGNALNLATTGANLTGDLVVDTTAPTVASVAALSGTGLVGIGGTVELALTMSEAVVVDTAGGTPTLALNSGGRAAYAGTDPTGGVLTFTYTSATGESTDDLAVTGLDLDGATIRDAAGNPADLSGAAVNPAGTIAVDTTAPDAPVVSGLGSRIGAGGLVVRGTAEAGSMVEVYQNAGPLGLVTAGPDGAWAVPLAGELDAGTYAFTATATDAAGNPSPTSSASTVTVAEQAPAGAEPAPVTFETGARGVEVTRTEAGDLVVTRGGVTEVLRGADELRFIDGRLVFDPDDAASRVARLYRAGLGRGVDQGGLEYWAKAVEAGTPLSELAAGFLASPEGQAIYGAASSDAGFVARLYRNVLGREGDAEGQAFWTRRLGEGASRAELLAAVADSGENRQATASEGVWDLDEGAARVARLYDTLFGRLPDQNGLAYWAEAVNADGATLQAMAEGFLVSPEAQAIYGSRSGVEFVRALYENTLDRPGDAGGVEYWTGRLDAGLSRAALVVSFSESPEHVAVTAADIAASAPGQFGIRLA